jgi:hypothetical protein
MTLSQGDRISDRHPGAKAGIQGEFVSGGIVDGLECSPSKGT